MKRCYLFLAAGFEEIEVVSTVDVLRRASIEVYTVSINSSLLVIGAHGIAITADRTIQEVTFDDVDALILPGGMPGSKHLSESTVLAEALVSHAAKGELIAAICAAPFVLGNLDLLKGHDYICYPSFENEAWGANHVDSGVVVSQNIITAKGPAFAIDFGLSIVEYLSGGEKKSEVAKGLLLI